VYQFSGRYVEFRSLRTQGGAVVLLRRVIGDALRARRQAQHRTLREVSTAANVSLGYLSEIERGQKEASSELLAAICEALGAALHEVLRDVTESLALADEVRGLVPVSSSSTSADGREPSASSSDEVRTLVPVGSDGAAAPDPGHTASASFDADSFGPEPIGIGTLSSTSTLAPGTLSVGSLGAGSVTAAPGSVAVGIPDGKVSVASATLSVAVHHDGPLRTTLRATRARELESAAA
jgi:transcriptional regulator with XRE-family HTH domain